MTLCWWIMNFYLFVHCFRELFKYGPWYVFSHYLITNRILTTLYGFIIKQVCRVIFCTRYLWIEIIQLQFDPEGGWYFVMQRLESGNYSILWKEFPLATMNDAWAKISIEMVEMLNTWMYRIYEYTEVFTRHYCCWNKIVY